MKAYSQKLREQVASCPSATLVSQQLMTIILGAANKYDELQAENKRLKEWLRAINSSASILEVRRFVEQALKGE